MMIDAYSTLFDGRTAAERGASTDGNGKTITADKIGHSYDNRNRDFLGTGEPLYLVVSSENVVSTGTYAVKLVEGTSVDSSTGRINAGNSEFYRLTIPPGQSSSVVWGTVPGGRHNQRYFQGEVDVGGTSPSIDVTAFLTYLRPESGADEQYPDAISFSTNA